MFSLESGEKNVVRCMDLGEIFHYEFFTSYYRQELIALLERLDREIMRGDILSLFMEHPAARHDCNFGKVREIIDIFKGVDFCSTDIIGMSRSMIECFDVCIQLFQGLKDVHSVFGISTEKFNEIKNDFLVLCALMHVEIFEIYNLRSLPEEETN